MRFIVDAKLIFRSTIGLYSNRYSFSTLTWKTSELLALVFLPGKGIHVHAARTLHGAWYTVGRRIVHSHVIIHRSPSLRFRPRISWILQEVARSFPVKEFCSSASRQAGYCHIPFRDLSYLVSKFRN